jgi:maltose alpha-D-glucosyltransferase/alpha-amylase
MQWSRSRNGGFSNASPDALCRPLVSDRRWGPAAINVADQERDEASLLLWMERLVRRRRAVPEIAFGRWSVLPLPEPAVLALRYDWEDHTAVTIHNLSAEPSVVSPRLEPSAGARWARLIDLLGQEEVGMDKDGSVRIRLDAYGHRWFRAERGEE